MKNYIKPTFEFFELKAEERLATSVCVYDSTKPTGNCVNGAVR